MLAGSLAGAALFLAHQLDLLPWQSLLWGAWVTTAVLASMACVLFPEHIADWLPESRTSSGQLPAAVIRIVGWCVLVLTAAVLGMAWLYFR
jgi:hypothetical protein